MNKKNYIEPNELTHTPIWIRLPRQGSRCPFTGLSRAVMHRLVAPSKENEFAPPVESKHLLQKGKNRGVRLVNFDSLVRYVSNFGEAES